MRLYLKIKEYLFPIFVVLAALVYLVNPLSWLDNGVKDLFGRVRQPVSDGIYVIELNDGAQRTYEQWESWSRVTCAWLVSTLNEQGTPAVIGIDMPLYRWSASDSDNALLSSIRSAKNAVLATRLITNSRNADRGVDGDNIGAPEPLAVDIGGRESGFSDLFADGDGSFRRGMFSADASGDTQYSFAAAVYRSYLSFSGAGDMSVPLLDGKSMWRFKPVDNVENFRHGISFSDLFSGAVPMSTFKDSIVLIGARPPQYTPTLSLAGGEPAFDTLLQAQLVQSLLYGSSILYVPRILQMLLLVAVLIGSRFAFSSISMAVRLGSLGGGVFGYILLCFLLSMLGVSLDVIYVPLALLVSYAVTVAEERTVELAPRMEKQELLQRYVSARMLPQLREADIEIEPHRQNIAVLFVDIRGFTPLSESISPSQLSEVLKEYLTLTSSAIFNNGGTLDKFIGDATMGFFNAPVEQDDYVYRAVKAAMDIVAGSDRINKMFKEKYDRNVRFGVGVHFGEAVVGMVGPSYRRDYTAIGDTVNTAARLESVADAGQILISMKVCAALEGRLKASYVGERPIKGKSKPMILYQVDSLDGITPSGKPEAQQTFD